MYARTPLGMIPDWQFSTDPAVNYHINPHVNYPAGVTQQTIQPLGDAVPPPTFAAGCPSIFTSPLQAIMSLNFVVAAALGAIGATVYLRRAAKK